MLLKNFQVFNRPEIAYLSIKDERINKLSFEENQAVTDCLNYYIVPGLCDLQVYGAGGFIFEESLSVECLEQIHACLLKHGTTSFLITLPTTSSEKIFKAINVVRQCMLSDNTGLVGLHLEGPFINPIRKGAHNPDHILFPDVYNLMEILHRGEGIIKMMTIAPEMFSHDLLQMAIASGIEFSLGHSNATCAQSQKAFGMGIKCTTHLYNAMSELGSREPGLVGATLLDEHIWATIVVDGAHVCYDTLRLALRLKPEKLVLISDATFLDVHESEVAIGGISVEKRGDQFYTKEGKLAGSAISLLQAVKNCMKHLNMPLDKAFEMATEKPSNLLRLTEHGKIGKGNRANLLLLNNKMEIKGSIFRGKWEKEISGND